MKKPAHGADALVLVLSATLFRGLMVGASPTPGDTRSGPSIPFVTAAQGTAAGVHAPIRMTIHDIGSWERLWIQLMAAGHRLPAVDFGRDMIIALSSGPVPGPATLTITRITRLPGKLVVWYTVAQPRPLPEGGSARRSSPFHVVRLARSPLPVDFVFLKTPPILWSPSAPAHKTMKG